MAKWPFSGIPQEKPDGVLFQEGAGTHASLPGKVYIPMSE